LPHLTLILLAAGNSTRFSKKIKKQWIRIGDDPLWLFVAKRFSSFYNFKEIVIVGSKRDLFYMKKFIKFKFVEGGSSRQESLNNALKEVETSHVLVSDVARSCIDKSMLQKIISSSGDADIIVPYLDVSDTVVYSEQTIDRDKVKLIQTPQLSKSEVLKKALATKTLYTDDSSAIQAIGGEVKYIKGSQSAKKITRFDDLTLSKCLKAPKKKSFIGQGFDVHQFCEGDRLYLCGVKIDSKFGFLAHSDGDVAIHALIDALLGAIGASDIGELYPDSDERFKNIDSKELLKDVVDFIRSVGFEIVNVDLTIMAEYPKISPYKDEMRETLSSLLQIDAIFCNIKATTTEKLGFIGRREGVAVSAVASLKYFDWGSGENEDTNS
jgi:2-C-methyl-D-erythritol 4-phosphate cytidylyltransferase/2-C-methyl-D-erythritol 2,4-cyclodiphosphate synthase